tara:strand:+ start:196 stop:495 length:300 start_codon:yes stop_codon:yes gene_type:complete
MIDTDKYEGHTEGPWRVENGSIHAKADWWSGAGDMIFFSKRHGQDANSQLIADAPLLLAEVKRLREGLRRLLNPYQHGLSNDKEPLPKWLGDAVWELIE